MSSPLLSLLPLAEALPAEEGARDRALTSLARRLANAASLPPELAALTLRLARSDLLDLYSGFALGAFASVLTRFRPQRFPPVAQARLHDRLRTLLTLPPARAEALSWLGAAMQGELTALLRERLSQARPLPRRLAAGALGVVNLLPAESDRTPEYEFALALLRLLLESADFTLPDPEFTALLAAVEDWVSAFPYFPEGRLRDLFLALHGIELTPPQRQSLRERLLAWRDLERYPPYRSFPNRRAYLRSLRRALGWSGPLASLAEWTGRFFNPGPVHPEPPDEETARRHRSLRLSTLIPGLALLARQDENAFPPLFEAFTELLRQYLLSLQLGGSVECEWALLDLLPAALAHPHWLEPLAQALETFRFYRLSENAPRELAERAPRLTPSALATLLDLRRRFPKHEWMLQTLEGCAAPDPSADLERADRPRWRLTPPGAGLTPAAQDGLQERLASSLDPEPVEAALRLLSHPDPSRAPLADALALNLTRRLQEGMPLPAEWVAELARNDEALRRVLLRLSASLNAEAAPLPHDFLRHLSDSLYALPALTLRKLTAACLCDPQNPLQSGLPLAQRLDEAAGLLLGRGDEAEILARLRRLLPPDPPDLALMAQLERRQDAPALRIAAAHPRLLPILVEAWESGSQTRAGAPRRLALARALASASPQHALPLLRDLFDIACQMYRGWYQVDRAYSELYREANVLAPEIARSLLTLSPLLPEAVHLLREMLLSRESLPEHGFHDLTPAFFREQILPLLVHKPIAPSTLPLLLNLLASPPLTEPHRQELLRQIALQALSNTSALITDQQATLWQHGYASPDLLTRALALLALGRQRPLAEQTWQTVRRLLRSSSLTLYNQRQREIARLNRQGADFFLGVPGQVFLLKGVAVALAAEWRQSPGLLTPAQRADLKDSLCKAASSFQRTLEARLTASSHAGFSQEHSPLRALALSLCEAVHRSPDDDPDWLLHPADLAYLTSVVSERIFL